MKILKSYQNTTPECNGNGISVYQEGVPIDILNFDPSIITIEKIARSLARIARYCGNTRQFYSVAQHCVAMASAALLFGEVHLAYAALHHESPEAIAFADIPGPIKQLLKESKLKEYEHKIEKIIMTQLGIEYPLPKEVKMLDNNIAQIELFDIKHNIECDYWDEDRAYNNFMAMHKKLELHIALYDNKELVS